MNPKVVELLKKGVQWATAGAITYCMYWIIKNANVTYSVTYPDKPRQTYEDRTRQDGMNFSFDKIIRKNDIIIDVEEVEKDYE